MASLNGIPRDISQKAKPTMSDNDQFDIKQMRSEFDAAGGNDLYTPEEMQDGIHKVQNGPIWKKAKEASEKEYGEIRWPFVMYLYQKLGGGK